MTALEQAKQSMSLPDLMARFGLSDHAKKSARCPFHDDRNNSFSVFQNESGEWIWNCFAGCGGGDAAAFVARVEGTSNGEGCRRLIELTTTRLGGGGRTEGSIPLCGHRLASPENPEPIGVMPDSVADAWNEGVDYVLAH